MKVKRIKNVWFWVGIAGVALAAINVDWHTFTSWGLVGQCIVDTVSNPVKIVSVAMAVVGVLTNPTTKGFKD